MMNDERSALAARVFSLVPAIAFATRRLGARIVFCSLVACWQRHPVCAGAICLAVALLGASASPAPPPDAPVVAEPPPARAAAATEALNIDGKLDEQCWKTITPLGDFVNVADGKPAQPGTQVQIATGRHWLYIGATCETEDVELLTALRRCRDSDVFNDDSFEVLLGPAERPRRVYRFVINSLGTRMDEVIPLGGCGVGNGRPFWRGHARRGGPPGQNRWTAELAIDLASLELGSDNEGKWRVNFLRHARGRSRSDSAWSQPRFWVFGCDWERMPTMAGIGPWPVARGCRLRVVTSDVRPDENLLRGRLVAELNNQTAQRRNFDVTLRTTTRLLDTRRVSVAENTRATVEFDFELALGEEPEMKIEASDPLLRLPLAATAHVLTVPPPVRTWFDRSYYSDEASAQFQAEITLPGSGDPPAVRQVKLRLFDAETGAMAWQSAPPVQTDPAGATSRVSAFVPLGRLPVGGYLMETVVDNPTAGRRYRFWTAMRRLAQHQGEVKADAAGFLRHDGVPFYPVEVRRMGGPGDMLFDEIQSKTAFNVNWGWYLIYRNPHLYVQNVNKATGCLGDMNVDHLYWARGPAREEHITRVKDLATLPCMFAYGMENLPGEDGYSTEPMTTVRSYLQSLAPHHPFYIVLGDPRQAERLRDSADFLVVRCRAIGPGGIGEPEWVYEQVRRARQGAGPTVPVVAMLSAYRDHEQGLERPTPQQMRAMTYLALAAGAAGVIFDGFYYRAAADPAKRGFSHDARLREMIYILSRHAAFLGPIVLAPEAPDPVVVEQPRDGPVRWTVRRYAGSLYVVAVNAAAREAYAAFRAGQGSNFAEVREIFENRRMALDGSRFSAEFEPYGTHVFGITEQR